MDIQHNAQIATSQQTGCGNTIPDLRIQVFVELVMDQLEPHILSWTPQIVLVAI